MLSAVELGQRREHRVVCECDARNSRQITFCRALGAEPVAMLDGRSALLLGWTPGSLQQP